MCVSVCVACGCIVCACVCVWCMCVVYVCGVCVCVWCVCGVCSVWIVCVTVWCVWLHVCVNSKIPLPWTLAEKNFDFSVQIPKNPKIPLSDPE